MADEYKLRPVDEEKPQPDPLLDKKTIDELLNSFEIDVAKFERQEPKPADHQLFAKLINTIFYKLDLMCKARDKNYIGYAARFTKLMERSMPANLASSRQNQMMYS